MTRLGVDPIRCTGHGVCAELLPEGITLDEWGYPLIARGELPPALLRAARRVAAACPTRALQLRDDARPAR
ncbi:MAG: ferredoxin [Blastococcus sp.]|nr:ferredoxin [Blastococcus sp.]